MGYSMDMSQESERKQLLPEGWREFKIIGCEEGISKAGNDKFIFTIVDKGTGQEEELHPLSVPKKRWLLKQILAACNVPASADGVYDWDIPDVIDKDVMGRVEHYPDEWINTKGETVVSTKHRIAQIAKTVEEGQS